MIDPNKKTSKNLGIREILVTFVEITNLMYVNDQKRKLLIFLGGYIEKSDTDTQFFNNSFPEYDDEYN